MLVLSDEYVQKLNADTQGGMFLKAVDLVENTVGPVMRYFVDHTESIVFNGQTYQPLKMRWDNLKTSQGMPIDGATVSVSNLGTLGQAAKYIKQVDVTDNEVMLRLLHLDLLSQTTGHWARKGYVLGVSGDVSNVTFTVGRRLGRNVLPRKIYTQLEFPALSPEIARIFT